METCSNDQTFCKFEPTSSCASLLLFIGNSSCEGLCVYHQESSKGLGGDHEILSTAYKFTKQLAPEIVAYDTSCGLYPWLIGII